MVTYNCRRVTETGLTEIVFFLVLLPTLIFSKFFIKGLFRSYVFHHKNVRLTSYDSHFDQDLISCDLQRKLQIFLYKSPYLLTLYFQMPY